MDPIYANLIAALLSFLLGLWARKLLKAACILFVAAKLVVIGFVVLGWATVPDFRNTVFPQLIAAAAWIGASLQAVVRAAPVLAIGFLVGVAVREVSIAVRSPRASS